MIEACQLTKRYGTEVAVNADQDVVSLPSRSW
jgi:hypothetical protein